MRFSPDAYRSIDRKPLLCSPQYRRVNPSTRDARCIDIDMRFSPNAYRSIDRNPVDADAGPLSLA